MLNGAAWDRQFRRLAAMPNRKSTSEVGSDPNAVWDNEGGHLVDIRAERPVRNHRVDNSSRGVLITSPQ